MFLVLFFKIPTSWSPNDFSGSFLLKGKLRKVLILPCLQNMCFLFVIFIWDGLQPGSPSWAARLTRTLQPIPYPYVYLVSAISKQGLVFIEHNGELVRYGK